MSTLTQSGQIKCGDHYLKAKVSFTEYRYEKYVDGTPLTLSQAPEITIKCLTCGREATAVQFAADTKTIERVFS